MNTDTPQSFRPPQVTIAAVLLIVSAVISTVYFFSYAGHHRTSRYVTWAVLTFLLLFLASMSLRGKNWARWVYLVLIFIAVLVSLFTIPGHYLAGSTIY